MCLSLGSSGILRIRSIKYHSVWGCVILQASFHGLMPFWYNLGTGPVNSGQLVGKQSLVHQWSAAPEPPFNQGSVERVNRQFPNARYGSCWEAMLKGPSVLCMFSHHESNWAGWQLLSRRWKCVWSVQLGCVFWMMALRHHWKFRRKY